MPKPRKDPIRQSEYLKTLHATWEEVRKSKNLMRILLRGEPLKVFLLSPLSAQRYNDAPTVAFPRPQAATITAWPVANTPKGMVIAAQSEGIILEVIYPDDFDRKPEFP